MNGIETLRYSEEFYPAGFRKVFALMLVVAVTVLPEVFSWAGGSGEQAASSFRSSSGFLQSRDQSSSSLWETFLNILKRGFVVLTAIFGVMLYYPRRGFKRYSLLCGPVIALTVPIVVAAYLSGRTEVYKAEILIVSLVALAPGVGLYLWLTWRKAKRLGMQW